MVKLAFNSQKQSCLRIQQPNHQHWQHDTWGSREGTVDVLTFYFSNDILVEQFPLQTSEAEECLCVRFYLPLFPTYHLGRHTIKVINQYLRLASKVSNNLLNRRKKL